jgi:hypothetical protein
LLWFSTNYRYSSLSQANHTDISSQLSDEHEKGQDAIRAQGQVLLQVQEQLKENNALLAAGNAVTNGIREALRLDWVMQLSSELRAFMHRIILINISTYRAVMAVQRTLSSGLERSLVQEPFILEDAIGRISPVHMQFINSWKAFHAVLSRRFEHLQGYNKVQRGEYILQEHTTRREISRSQRWEAAFLPGQRIDKSLIFNSKNQDSSVGTSCPSCKTNSDYSQDLEVLW